MTVSAPEITRLAPSPTGALHVGNARTFLATWLLARQGGWKIILRVDDLDGPRVKAGAAEQLLDDLRFLGLDWDAAPMYQSSNHAAHAAAIETLVDQGAVYPCVCTRTEIERAASAPHAEDGSTIYPGTCRGRYASVDDAVAQSGRRPALRFATAPGVRGMTRFFDRCVGLQTCEVARELGDFVIAKPDGTPAYHLATVVDDAAAGVTEVVRGDDLLDSTPRQILLYNALGLTDLIPAYTHLPLVVGPDGRRLAKRHGDSRLATYRAAGISAERMLALLARSLGIKVEGGEATASDFVGRFKLSEIPAGPITFDGQL